MRKLIVFCVGLPIGAVSFCVACVCIMVAAGVSAGIDAAKMFLAKDSSDAK